MPPATLNLSRYFCPISETPSQNLTASILQPSQDAEILLLSGEDVSKVLFTVYSDKGAPIGKGKGRASETADRNISFTCSNEDAAILARNVLVLFAILDDKCNKQNELIWEIQYNVFLTPDALELLDKTARTLLSLTKNLEDWHNTHIGSRLRFASKETLVLVRRFWRTYINEALPWKEEILGNMWYTYEKSKRLVSGRLPIQPRKYRTSLSVRSRSSFIFYSNYWMNGVVFGQGHRATACNPTMIFSDVRGSDFALHYTTNPILAFNTAPAFEQLDPSNPLYIPGFTNTHDWETLEIRIAVTMKMQFKLWSMSFQDHFEKVRLRFMVGDALAFCTNLAHENDGVPFTYTRQWSSTLMKFDDEILDSESLDGETSKEEKNSIPRSFNVIDTSNLGESLGLLNVLLAIRPLLKDESSTIFTEKVYTQPDENGIMDSFKADLCGDPKTMFQLLGITPVPHLSEQPQPRTMPRNSIWQTIRINRDETHWDRTAWRIPTLPHRINPFQEDSEEEADTPELTSFLTSVYFAMFAGESADFTSDFVIRYTRADFANFIFFLEHYIQADWLGILKDLSARAKQDEFEEGVLKFGPLGDMELDIQLHLHSLWTHEIFKEPLYLPNQVSHMSHYPGALAQQDTGEIICINMVVPRSKLEGLRSSQANLKKIHTPYLGRQNLRVSVHDRPEKEEGEEKRRATTYLKFHSSIQLCYGKVRGSSNSRIRVKEDPLGWEGEGDLILWFFESTKALREFDPTQIRISLYCHRSPAPTYYFSDDDPVKRDQIVYESQLAGGDCAVHVTANPPGLSIANIRESYIRDEILPGA